MKHPKKYIMFGVGLLVTIGAFWYSTRQVKLNDFLREIHNFNAWWLVPAFITFYYSMYLRAVRWGLLFRPYHKLSGYELFPPLMICFAFNCLLPGRVGEVVRAYVVGKRKSTGVPTALATVVAERILDSVTMMGMLAFSLMVLPPLNTALKVEIFGASVTGHQFNTAKRGVIILSVLLVIGLIVFMIPLTQRLMHGTIERLPLLGAKLKAGLRHILDQFAKGFHALHSPWVLAKICLQSLAIWALIGLSNQMVAKGFGLPMNLSQAEAGMVMIGIFITIPAAPGYWGLYEAGAIFSLFVFQLVRVNQQSLALAFALTIHLLQYVPIVVLGLFYAWRMQLKPTAAAEMAEEAADAGETP